MNELMDITQSSNQELTILNRVDQHDVVQIAQSLIYYVCK